MVKNHKAKIVSGLEGTVLLSEITKNDFESKQDLNSTIKAPTGIKIQGNAYEVD